MEEGAQVLDNKPSMRQPSEFSNRLLKNKTIRRYPTKGFLYFKHSTALTEFCGFYH